MPYSALCRASGQVVLLAKALLRGRQPVATTTGTGGGLARAPSGTSPRTSTWVSMLLTPGSAVTARQPGSSTPLEFPPVPTPHPDRSTTRTTGSSASACIGTSIPDPMIVDV